MANLTPPQPPPVWTHTPKDVLDLTKEAIKKDREVQDRIAKLPASECNFETVFLALANSDAEFQVVTDPVSFYQNVSPSKELRDASNEAEQLVNDFGVESSMRIDVYNAKVAAQKNIKASGKELNPEEQRLVEKMVQDGTRAGLALPEADRERLTVWKKELSQVCLEFSKNFNEEKGFISFTLEELKGVPEDVISGYAKRTESGKELYDVTHKTPDIFPLFKYAQSAATRRRGYESYEARLELNAPLLDRALELRRNIATLLGTKTWANHVTEVKMIKSGDNIKKFLTDLEQRLRPLGSEERETLLQLKAEELKAKGEPFDGEFYIWDYRYYDRIYLEKTLSLDDALIKEYFPVSVVVPAILEIYQNLLGVRFHKVNDTQAWHPDAQVFAVWAADAKDESDFVGYCYLDLFPRESKYGHAAVWPLIPGYRRPDGKRNYPLAAMVANLAKSTPDRPALMRHDDVVTFFHEMGHVFHGLLSHTQFSRFHGTKVARDFVEAPSQMLENWCWEPQVLKKVSRHYKTNEVLSDELISTLVQSRYVNVGLFYLRQLFFAWFDYQVHTSKDKQDVTALWNDLREQVSLVKGGRRSAGQGSFGHIVGGYDAGYYGYTYSLVFAADMYSAVFKSDPFDPARGDRYRKSILGPGGSREELDSLKEFLGRDPNPDAFMEEIFGKPTMSSSSLTSLFQPMRVGAVNVQHRVVMAPLTRLRANKGHIHGELAKTYYGQRAGIPGTLIVSEATFIAPQAGGYANAPGIWSDAQIAGWKTVTDAVHGKGSFIFLQLWALGRVADPTILKEEGGFEVVGPSPIPSTSFEKSVTPRELTVAEIEEYVQLYAKAARNAIEAGFDGVEIHAANGYLLDQFLQTVSNMRTDQFGGSIQNRIRFPLEVVDAVVKAVGAERTGVRISPWSDFQDMGMKDPLPTFTAFVERIRDSHPNLGHIHVIEDLERTTRTNSNDENTHSNEPLRKIWGDRPYIAAGGFNRASANSTVEKHGGLIAFGRHFIANPDLPLRLKEGIALTQYNRDTFYLPEAAAGYVDYPFANEVAPLEA